MIPNFRGHGGGHFRPRKVLLLPRALKWKALSANQFWVNISDVARHHVSVLSHVASLQLAWFTARLPMPHFHTRVTDTPAFPETLAHYYFFRFTFLMRIKSDFPIRFTRTSSSMPKM